MTPDLIQIADALRDLGDFSPTLDSTHCLNAIHQHAGKCTTCRDACPFEAVHLQPAPEFDSGRCLGCDACVAACPTSALQGRFEPLEVWRKIVAGAQDGVATMTCRATGSKGATAQVPCASAVPAEFYIGLSAAGIRKLTFYTANCEACSLYPTLNQAQDALNVMRTFLAHLGLQLELNQEFGKPPEAEDKPAGLSRRQFLRGLAGRAAAPALTRTDHLDDFVAGGYGWRHALLMDALVRQQDIPDINLPSQAGYWGGLEVSSKCVGCAMCVQFCPTDALFIEPGDDGQVALWLDTARCTACDLCQRVCFKKAITPSEEINLQTIASGQPVLLWQGVPPVNPLSKQLNKTRAIR